MVQSGHLLVVLLIPVVSGFDGFLAHQKAHESGSVRRLKAKETVHDLGSDIVFSWAKCVICDGYDVRLYLQDISGKQEIPYQLKSAVTALKVTNVPARTTYKLVVKRLPTDTSSSEVSGRSSSPEAPSPVEQLQALAVTSSLIEVEWKSKNADGFILRILENNTLELEKVIPDFSNHSTLNISGLKPETNYDVQVTAFYFPPIGKSISTVSSAQVRTLPLVLPRIDLKWKFDSEPKVFWENPAFPAPVAHQITCTKSSSIILQTRISGAADFVVLSRVTDTAAIECVLDTWFSKDEGSKRTSRVQIQKHVESSPPSSSQSDRIQCGSYSYNYDYTTIETSGEYVLQNLDGTQFLVLQFSYDFSSTSSVNFEELQYKLCVGTVPCGNDWKSSKDYSRVIVSPAEMKAWVPQIVYFRFKFSCSKNYGYSQRSPSTTFTTIGSVKVPAQLGRVDPVTEIRSTASQVSWSYRSSTISPDYFLVTYCTGDSCTSQSAPGQNRSISLGELKPRHVYFVTIQAVKLWAGKAVVSSTEMTSFVAPKPYIPDDVTLTFNEIANSSTVRLVIAHNVAPDEPPIVEYHVAVCSKPVSLWKDPFLVERLSSNGSCDSIVSTNSSLDLIREPWTSYEVSVLLCYGSFDFNDPVNLTAPIFKRIPSPLTGLSWYDGSSTLAWEYDSSIPSGFSISICPSDSLDPKCNNITAGPLDREQLVDTSDLTDGVFIATVHAFVTYEGLNYDGPRSELEVNITSATPLPVPVLPDELLLLNDVTEQDG